MIGSPRFAVEASMGRLATQLRLLGFDTAYQQERDAEAFFKRTGVDRIALIRTRHLRGRLPQKKWLFIRDNDPEAQVRSVLDYFKLKPSDTQSFSRCARCNRPVEMLSRAAAQGLVPDHVWLTHTRFSTCPECGRVFWPGSHTSRHQKNINHWFRERNKNNYDE